MRYAPRALLAGGLGFAVSVLVACGGGSGLLSGDQSSHLNSQLDAVSAAVHVGSCSGAATAVSGFSHVVGNLPASVSPTLRANLIQGASTVGRLAANDCHKTTTHKSATATTPSTTVPTTTTSSSETTTSSAGSSSNGNGSGGAGLVGSANGNGGGNGQ